MKGFGFMAEIARLVAFLRNQTCVDIYICMYIIYIYIYIDRYIISAAAAYGGTSLMRNRLPLGFYSRLMPRVLG